MHIKNTYHWQMDELEIVTECNKVKMCNCVLFICPSKYIYTHIYAGVQQSLSLAKNLRPTVFRYLASVPWLGWQNLAAEKPLSSSPLTRMQDAGCILTATGRPRLLAGIDALLLFCLRKVTCKLTKQNQHRYRSNKEVHYLDFSLCIVRM